MRPVALVKVIAAVHGEQRLSNDAAARLLWEKTSYPFVDGTTDYEKAQNLADQVGEVFGVDHVELANLERVLREHIHAQGERQRAELAS